MGASMAPALGPQPSEPSDAVLSPGASVAPVDSLDRFGAMRLGVWDMKGDDKL